MMSGETIQATNLITITLESSSGEMFEISTDELIEMFKYCRKIRSRKACPTHEEVDDGYLK